MQDLTALNRLTFDEQIEREILSAMLTDPAVIKDLYGVVEPDDFYTAKHRALCAEIYRLWMKDEKAVAPAEVLAAAQKHNISSAEVVELYSPFFTSLNLDGAVKRLKAFSGLRKAQAAAARIAAIPPYAEPEEINRQIGEIAGQLTAIGEASIGQDELMDQSDAVYQLADRITRIYEGEIEEERLKTGLKELDNLIKLRGGELIVIGARPGMGKTALSLKLIDHISGVMRKRSLYFSLEMDRESMLIRMAQALTRLEYDVIKDGQMTEEEYRRLVEAFGVLGEYPVVWSDKPGQTADEMLAKARKVKRESGLDFIVVDYLGLMGAPYRGCDTYERVTENTKLLKNMARELDVPVVALCQLSRAPETRMDKRPNLSDLRESGEIEQTANIVAFLYRETYYNEEADDHTLEIIVRKNRNGKTGTAKVFYKPEWNMMADLDKNF